MKVIILIDSNDFDSIVESVNSKEILIVNTEHCDPAHEYQHLLDAIREFDRSKNEIMLARFTGKERVIKELGDEFSEMILALSSNKRSQYYVDFLAETFLEIIQTFEKETATSIK